jgi:UDP-N-acetylglucosamine--N-acetylmuramyl-(pentapeptide) pyrophosphoryl-undecaprenol N-acetylglucosamine transferase
VKTLLVVGGSLGSGPLNETVPSLVLGSGVQVLHIAGPASEQATAAAWSRSSTRAHVVGYLDTIEDAYLAADLALCRSGALTVSELAVAGLPSVLVPLETLARGDQAANARVLERSGAAVVVAQSGPDLRGRLEAAVTDLLADDAARGRMRDGAATVARPDAAARLADVVESLA